jgi:ABC-2 type transport system permease protein
LLPVLLLFQGSQTGSYRPARVRRAAARDSPLKKPPGDAAQTMAVQFGGTATLVLLVAPEARLMAAQLISGSEVPGWINLFLGPVLGLAFLAAGVRLGGKWMDERGPELLARLAVNR